MSFVVIVVIVVFGSFTNSLALSLSRSLSLLHTHMFFADICNFDFISDFSQMCLFAVYLNAWLPFYYMHTCTFPCAIMQLILTEMVIYCVQYGSSISQNDSSRNIISLPSAIASLCVCVCVNALNGEKFLYDCNNYVQVKVTSCLIVYGYIVWTPCCTTTLYLYCFEHFFSVLFFSPQNCVSVLWHTIAIHTYNSEETCASFRRESSNVGLVWFWYFLNIVTVVVGPFEYFRMV